MTTTAATTTARNRPPGGMRGMRMRMFVSTALLSLLLLAAWLPPASGSCSVDAECGAHGTCLPSRVCQCDEGWLGAACDADPSDPDRPVFVSRMEGALGQRIVQEWRILPPEEGAGGEGGGVPSASRRLHLRWTVRTDAWFGGILDAGWDGMTSGDSWNFWVSDATPPVVYLGDYYSFERGQPRLDEQQDLQLVNGWRADGWQCAEWIRPLDTGDRRDDQVLSDTPGTWVRVMWTTGMTQPDASKLADANRSGKSLPHLTMHGYVGHTGQFRVDFAGGIAEMLPDGVKWPQGYWVALWMGGAMLLLFGLVLQRDCVQHSRLGWWLRSRPLKGVRRKISGADAGSGSDRPAVAADITVTGSPSFPKDSWARGRSPLLRHVLSLQLVPTCRNLSAQELLFLVAYLATNLAVVLSSMAEYEAIGRSFAYVLGHLASLHLALATLPASRNSFLLPLCGVSFDVAVTWHRRWGIFAVGWLLAHAASMVLIWEGDVLGELDDSQFGMGPLYGTVALVAFLALFLSSVEWVRRNRFEWFLHAHLVLVAVGYIGALMHSINFRWLLLLPGALFLFDVVMRLVVNPWVKFGGAIAAQTGEKNNAAAAAAAAPESSADDGDPDATSSSTAIVSGADAPLYSNNPRAQLVRLECHGLHDAPSLHTRVVVLTLSLARAGPGGSSCDYPPGCWLMVRVPEISRWEWHPFSVSSVRHEESRTLLTLHVLAVPTRQVSWRSLRRQWVDRCASSSQVGGDGDVDDDPVSVDGVIQRSFTEQLYDLAVAASTASHNSAPIVEPLADAPSSDSHPIAIHVLPSTDAEGDAHAETIALQPLAQDSASDSSTFPSQPHHSGDVAPAGTGVAPLPAAPAPFSLFLDGPYPGLRLPVFRFRVLVLVAGGIGVTPLMPILDRFMQRMQRRHREREVRDSDHAPERHDGLDGESPDEDLPLRVYFCWTARSSIVFRTWFPSQMRALASCGLVRTQLHSTHPHFEADCARGGFEPAPQDQDRVLCQGGADEPMDGGNGAHPHGGRNGSLLPAASSSSAVSVSVPAGRRVGGRGRRRRDGFASIPLHDVDGADSPTVPPDSPSAAHAPASAFASESEKEDALADGAAVPAAAAAEGDASADCAVEMATSTRAESPLPHRLAAPSDRSPARGVSSLWSLHRGRPDLAALLDRVQADMDATGAAVLSSAPSPHSSSVPVESLSDGVGVGRSSPRSVLVLSCGPERLVEDCEAEAERRHFHFAHEQFEY